MWSYYQWIRRQVELNTPWDELVRDLLTATGSTLENGAGNFFILHDEPTKLAETVSRRLPRHVDQLREVPQPPDGEVDERPVFRLRQSLLPRALEERRGRR